MSEPLVDRLGRPIRDLRISVTDRCNFRCVYCMPKEIFGPDHAFLERSELLSFEEITRLATIFSGLGVQKLRLTGGEPLIRRGVEDLIGMLSPLPGLDIALTTNGSTLTQMAEGLARAGLDRVTVSLDSLDDERFNQINDVRFPVGKVLDGIEAASAAGLSPIKINMVVKRGVNDGDVVDMARHFKGSGHIVRFIEYMDVGTTNGWRLDEVVPAAEILARINEKFPLEVIGSDYRGEVAKRYRYVDGGGEIGFITSVTQPFCGDCTRARISSEGKLFTCLFAAEGFDLRGPMRSGATDDDLIQDIRAVWSNRGDRYSELRSAATDPVARVEMSYIGG